MTRIPVYMQHTKNILLVGHDSDVKVTHMYILWYALLDLR